MPFVTAGDPDLAFTAELLRRLDQAGCDLVELGIPYSDPVADGPVIQDSYTRALDNGVRLEETFGMLSELRGSLSMPVVVMVSFAIVFRKGLDAFVDQAVAAGVAGVIVPDLPVDESAEFNKLCESNGLSLIQLITPTTPRQRAAKIADQARGFIYYVSVTGITGERQELPADLIGNLTEVREQTQLPICVGFGIRAPEQVEMLNPHCDGVIVGSAIVKRIASISQEGCSRTEVLDQITSFAQSMLTATQSIP